MANREKQSRNWLIVVGGVFVLAVFNENIASWLEQYGLNRLWAHTGVVGAGLLWVWKLIVSPVLTHIYAFLAGLLVANVARHHLKAVPAVGQGGLRKPDMSLHDLVDYIATQTSWAKSQRAISDRMVEHELLDAISTGRLQIFARESDSYGSTSQLFRIGGDYFDSHRIDFEAVRTGRGSPVVVKPSYFTGSAAYHDWRVFKVQAEQLWPRWVEPATTVRKGLFGRKFKA